MAEKRFIKRFGTIAIEKGFITKDQFIDAMAMQIENDLEGSGHWILGSLLSRMDYMTPEQINEVIEAIGAPTKLFQKA